MPQIFKTYDEIEQELAHPRTYGGGNVAGTSPVSTVTAQPEPVSPTSKPTSPTSPTTTPPIGNISGLNIREYTGNPELQGQYATLFGDITSQIGEETKGIATEAGKYREAAGTPRTWEGIGGAAQVQKALNPAADVSDIEAAKSLANASFAAPAMPNWDQFAADISNLQQTGRAIGTGAGTQALLQSRATTPATPGELEVASRSLLENPAYQQAARAARADIEALSGALAGAQGGAQALAAQRTAQEEEIARRAREQLLGARGALDKTLEERIGHEKADEDLVDQAISKFLESGDISAFTGLPEDVRGTGLATIEQDPNRALYAEGLKALKGVLSQYADIQDIPYMTPQITTRGYGTIGWTPEDYASLQAKYPDRAALEAVRRRAVDRQQALTAAGFDPMQTNPYAVNKDYVLRVNPAAGVEPGKYATMFPSLAAGNLWDIPDLRSYIQAEGGVQPTQENLATPEERTVYNRISEILGLEGRLNEAKTPYEKKQIVSDAGKLLDDEIKSLEARKAELTESEQAYLNSVLKARHAYLKAAKKKAWGKAFGIIGAVFGGAMFGGVLGIPGYKVGEKIGSAVGGM